MTPDLMEEGARRLHKTLAPALPGQTESGGRAAGFSRIAVPGEVDVTHGRILYLEDVHVSFDGFKAINGLSLDIAPWRAALHHRPQWCGQDDDDGHHHGQDAAGQRHGVFWLDD